MTKLPETSFDESISKGGEFLIRQSGPAETFIPEEANEEQLMVRQMVKDFIEQEIRPNFAKIDKQEPGLTVGLLGKIAELGLLGTHMPEELGGMALDTNTNTFICEDLGPAGSFTTSFAAHTGIGMLPILYYGTEEQKQKFLPRLISGELKASYCLTEPGSGSDALSAKTTAVLSEDGTKYIVNGQKMWITNAGFADIFILFAKIDGEKFTGFVVEQGTPGLTLGAEEDKLGIKGSSTRQVYFENMEIPVDSVLGEIGKGHLIAFNVLNIGRFKLGALTLGGAKKVADTAIKYANERHQFKVPIGSFGAIKYKISEQVVRLFATESAQYRVSNLIQLRNKGLMAEGKSFDEAKRASAEEYAIECSILKVTGSEALDYVVDETVQIHGGMGYSEEGTVARAFRDARINRIFEGTNEINRLLMVDQLLRRAMKGELDIVSPAWAVQKELASMPSFDQPEGDYALETKAVADFKKIILMVAGAAAKDQMDGKINLKEEQMLLMNVADMMIDTYLTESTLLRVIKLKAVATKKQDQEFYEAILRLLTCDAQARIAKSASDALASFAEGDVYKALSMGVKRFTKYPTPNVRNDRRLVADVQLKANAYAA
jgi:alkylation response protein AidB-like acyl-CoA dehydrogenase